MLLSFSMLVIERGKTLYVLSPMQFLDSPDWFDDSCDHFYQVKNNFPAKWIRMYDVNLFHLIGEHSSLRGIASLALASG
jgi:hypothetical protein